MPYIARFGLESSRIGTRTLSKMITFIPFHDISAFCPKAKEGFHPFYETFFPNSDAGGPFVLTRFWTISQVFLYPSPVARPEMIVGFGSAFTRFSLDHTTGHLQPKTRINAYNFEQPVEKVASPLLNPAPKGFAVK